MPKFLEFSMVVRVFEEESFAEELDSQRFYLDSQRFYMRGLVIAVATWWSPPFLSYSPRAQA